MRICKSPGWPKHATRIRRESAYSSIHTSKAVSSGSSATLASTFFSSTSLSIAPSRNEKTSCGSHTEHRSFGLRIVRVRASRLQHRHDRHEAGSVRVRRLHVAERQCAHHGLANQHVLLHR